MAISIVVPQLGESVAEGTVAKWLKAVGDKVRKEEPLVEIQTDKINVEIPSPAEGTLTEIVVAEGTTVLVGTEIGRLSGGAEAPVAAVSAAAAPAAAKTAAASAGSSSGVAVAARPAASGNGIASGPAPDDARTLSPAVRKLMREHNVGMAEVAGVTGSGVGGRVTRDDLLDHLSRRPAGGALVAATAAAAAPVAAAAPAPLPSFLQGAMSGAAANGPRETTVAFTRVRKAIADNMVKAKHTAAHTHCFDEVDMSAIVALRKEWGPKLEKSGVKLT